MKSVFFIEMVQCCHFTMEPDNITYESLKTMNKLPTHKFPSASAPGRSVPRATVTTSLVFLPSVIIHYSRSHRLYIWYNTPVNC